MDLQERIERFLDGSPHAVVGASRHRAKYDNKVLRVYLQNDRQVYAVNPNAEQVEGLEAYPNLGSLPQSVHGVSVITPPAVTETVVEQAAQLGIRHVWMQPGAESDQALEHAEASGINVIAGDACLFVVLGFHES